MWSKLELDVLQLTSVNTFKKCDSVLRTRTEFYPGGNSSLLESLGQYGFSFVTLNRQGLGKNVIK